MSNALGRDRNLPRLWKSPRPHPDKLGTLKQSSAHTEQRWYGVETLGSGEVSSQSAMHAQTCYEMEDLA